MSTAIQLGPLLVPFSLLLVFASGGLTLALGKWLSKSSAEVDSALWLSLLAGVVLARLAFVFEYRSLYLAAPLTILDIRDGGWSAPFGLLGAWMYALYRERKAPAIKRPSRWALALGTAIFFVGTTVLSFQGASGQRLPELTFTSLDGKTVPLREFEGKPTVVNLWATWCPPCVREMPVLHAAQDKRTDVNFVFVNQGEEGAKVSRWLEGQRLSMRNVLLDPHRKASAAFQQQGYPTTLFFNTQGELVSSRIGELSSATLNEKLEMLTP
ncbi:MAG: TlpA disulfide reductase family protein [Pseudomonadota bacterium]